MKPPSDPAWVVAIRQAIVAAGGGAALARAVGVTPSCVSHWNVGISRVSANRVLAIEAATRGAVSRHDIRPDIYPREGQAA